MDIPEIKTRQEGVLSDAVSVAAATMVGAAVGTWLDNNTKFGRWANTSPTADAIVAVFKRVAALVGVGLVVLFIYCLLTT